MNIPIKNIRKGILKFRPSSKRLKIFTIKNSIKIIDDTYNANPSSMKAAISVLAKQKPVLRNEKSRKIAVLGDMLELGSYSKILHKDIGKYIDSSNIDSVISIGKFAKYYCRPKKGDVNLDNINQAVNLLNKYTQKNDILLFKASRSMNFDKLLNIFLDTYI